MSLKYALDGSETEPTNNTDVLDNEKTFILNNNQTDPDFDENNINWNWFEEWSIAGARISIASMFVFWAETALTGWPKPKRDHDLEAMAVDASEIYFETKEYPMTNLVKEELLENEEDLVCEKVMDDEIDHFSENKILDENEDNAVYGDKKMNLRLISRGKRKFIFLSP